MRTKFPVTVHLFFFREGQILLLRRLNTGYADGQYSVPAGHLDGDESVIAAGLREGLEEVGVQLAPSALHFSSVMHRREDDERVDFFFEVQRWDGEPFNAEPEKCDDVRWFAVDALPENMAPYVRQALGNHFSAKQFDEYGW